MYLQFHKTLFNSQIADCLALKMAPEGIIQAPFSRSLFIFVFRVGNSFWIKQWKQIFELG